MSNKVKIAGALLMAIVIILFAWDGCEKNETILPDGNIQIAKEIETKTSEIKAIQAVQDTTAREAKEVIMKSIESPRIKDLRPIDVIPRNPPNNSPEKGVKPRIDGDKAVSNPQKQDTFSLKSRCDSLFREALYKEMLLDSLAELTNRLLTQGLAERKMHLEKDSLNHELIVNLNGSVDSLKAENKKLAKKVRRNWQVAKAAFGIGFAGGVATSVLVK